MPNLLEPADIAQQVRAPGRGGAAVRTEGGREFMLPAQAQQDFSTTAPAANPALQDRGKFEEFLQGKYGDPWADERELAKKSLDMNKVITEKTSKLEQEAFEFVFEGKYRYEDRGRLGNKDQDFWQDSLLQLRKNVEDEHKQEVEAMSAEIAVRKDQMGDEMKAFDDYVKMFKPTKTDKTEGGWTTSDMNSLKGIITKAEKEERTLTAPEKAMAEALIREKGLPFDLTSETSPEEIQTLFGLKSDWKGLNWVLDILNPDPEQTGTLELTPKATGKPRAMPKNQGESVEEYLKRTKGK